MWDLVLQTERLILRPFAPDDLTDCDRLFRDVWGTEARPEWLAWASRNLYELAALRQPPYGDRALILRETGTMIGSAGLVPSLGPFGVLPGFDLGASDAARALFTPEVGLFWMLAPGHRGRGFAIEAGRALIALGFGPMNLRRIVATTEDANTASQGVMRRLGMRIVRNPGPEPAWFQTIGVLDNPKGTV